MDKREANMKGKIVAISHTNKGEYIAEFGDRLYITKNNGITWSKYKYSLWKKIKDWWRDFK